MTKLFAKKRATLISLHTRIQNRFVIFNINARSILDKSDDLESALTVYDPDVTAVTETWLSDRITD
ncbi:hypothetical protein HPB48_002663 [Haemaphysalis longicornis]|uniref:Uncharacterized protein n=1 Tax=Haemaphysalis longicornis TaxID=44386 RepID=A0A9J6GW87_HAELO|nr:hypothetical protein HPB48_002663 [Haemaphysalis longicornis]